MIDVSLNTLDSFQLADTRTGNAVVEGVYIPAFGEWVVRSMIRLEGEYTYGGRNKETAMLVGVRIATITCLFLMGDITQERALYLVRGVTT